MTIIASYVPGQLPQGGPNYYSFGENIRYEIHIDNNVATRGDDIVYRFTFDRRNEDPTTIEAMELAVDAGAPGDENTEWCRVQLGKLYEKIGKNDHAKMNYTIAVQNRENYPYALAGLAGIAAGEEKYPEALALYLRADSLIPDHTFKEGIAELYQLTGEKAKAEKMANDILAYMQQYSSDNKKGQNEDHELAHAFMGVGNFDKALEFALAGYNRRPENIEVNETVAIVYFKKGEFAKALPHIETALKTNCNNPELLCHAGLIYAKTTSAPMQKISGKSAGQ